MDFHKAITQGFTDAPFIAHMGIALEGLGPGWCEARLDLEPWHLQQTGVAHAGVIATLADHCRAEVLKPGRTLSVVEAAVFAESTGKRQRVHARSGLTSIRCSTRHGEVLNRAGRNCSVSHMTVAACRLTCLTVKTEGRVACAA